jgi:hypothetical protein
MCFGFYDDSGFIMKSYSDIFILILKFIFNFSLSQQNFPIPWKSIAISLFLK